MRAVAIDARLERNGGVHDLPSRKIIVMTLKTEGTPLLHQLNRFTRSRRFQMTQLARFALEWRVQVLPEERGLFGIMRIMTIDAVGLLNRVPEVDFLDFCALRVMTCPAQRHRVIDQISHSIGRVGIVTCQTATFCGQWLVDVSCIEVVPVVAAETHFGTIDLQETGGFGTVRLVTPIAVPFADRCMNGRLFQQFLDLRMTRNAEFALLGFQKTLPVSRMGVVAIGTSAIDDRRVRSFQDDLLADILVTGGAERVILALQQDLTGRGMWRVARRAHSDLERVVLVDSRHPLHQLAVTVEAEDLLIAFQKVGEPRTVRFVAGEAPFGIPRGRVRAGFLIEPCDQILVTRLTQVVPAGFQ